MPPTERSQTPLIRSLRKLLAEPRLASADVDSGDFVELHRRILREKPLMGEVFREIYDAVVSADEKYFTAQGARVELGAGSSFLGDIWPGVIGTDIKYFTKLDAVVDAQALPFKTASVRAYYGIDCFHHFPDPSRFFEQLVLGLAPGAGCVLIEPYHGPLASFLFRRLFASERFDKGQTEWTTVGAGPMSSANQALSYIVFQRDRVEFERRFPELEVVHTRPMTNHIRYFLSGGLNFRSFLPVWLGRAVRGVEWSLTPLARWIALHHLIVLRRRARPLAGPGL